MKLTDYLGDKPFWRVTVKLAVPVALQNVLTSSFQLVDTLMVSQLGDVTLSAVGMAAQWGWLCGLLGFGLCSGMSVFISQYWGVKDLKGIRRVMGIGLIWRCSFRSAFWPSRWRRPHGCWACSIKTPPSWKPAAGICASSASPILPSR